MQSYVTYGGDLFRPGDSVIFNGIEAKIHAMHLRNNKTPIATIVDKDGKIHDVNVHDLEKVRN